MAINLEKSTKKPLIKRLFDIFTDDNHCETLHDFIRVLAIIEDVVIEDVDSDTTILNNKKNVVLTYSIDDWRGTLTVQVHTKDENRVLGFTLGDLTEGTAITYAM